MDTSLVKLFWKTLAAMLTISCSGLLLETSALALDSVVTEQPTVSQTRNMMSVMSGEAGEARSGSVANSHNAPSTFFSDPTKVKLPNQDLSADLALENSQDPDSGVETTPIVQVNSVSGLTDVQSTDWAFQALQLLVERYGCIEGYPDRTYRGNRALTRYEFAAGLNKCLDRIGELITTSTNSIRKEDLVTVQRLQSDFAAELASLRGRIDAVEARTVTLEKQQFSTTTKLSGLLVTHLGDAWGENAGKANNTIFGYEAYLNLNTSFTGKDSLALSLVAGNTRKLDTATKFPQGRLSGGTDETRFVISNGETYGDGNLGLGQLQYRFPVGKKVMVSLDAYSSDRLFTQPITPLNNLSTGAVSYYGKINPLLYPFSPQTGLGLQWIVAPWLSLDFSLASDLTANNPGRGLFNGGYGASVRPVISLGRLKLTASYINSYSPSAGIDTLSGSNAAKVIGAGPVAANTYVGGAFYRFSPTFELGGSLAYSNARALGNGTRGDAHVSDYRVNFVFYDLGKKGSLAGLIFGTEPRLTGTSNASLAEAIGLPPGQRSDRNVGFHVEAFYSYPLTDKIAITPGVFWLTAPNHDARNPDAVVGVIRTSFSF